MIKKIGIVTTMLLIFGLVISFGYAQAIMIPILNAGFEDPQQSEGKYTDNEVVPGWEIYSDNIQKKYWYGVWNPTTDDYPDGVPEGVNVGYIETESGETGIVGFEQTLSATLMENTTYLLQVDIGNPLWEDNASWEGFPGYRIELLAGGVVLASDDNTLSPSDGTFNPIPSEVSFFTAQSDHARLGEALTIRLLNISAGEGREVNFDNVRLTAAPVPEPATMLLLGAGLIGLAGLGRKKFKKK